MPYTPSPPPLKAERLAASLSATPKTENLCLILTTSPSTISISTLLHITVHYHRYLDVYSFIKINLHCTLKQKHNTMTLFSIRPFQNY